jgi:hypothetical protein
MASDNMEVYREGIIVLFDDTGYQTTGTTASAIDEGIEYAPHVNFLNELY